MAAIKRTERTRVKRVPDRGKYDRAVIDAILDEALIAHVAFDHDGAPAIIPTGFWRNGNELLIHGSSKSRMLLALRDGAPCCVCVTLLDGLVLARSAFHHSINYRSVVVYGAMHEISDAEPKLEALKAFTDRVAPGRWPEIRPPNAQEFKATTVLSMPINEASAKVRVGPPADDEPDYALPVWAGVVPIRLTASEPETDPAMKHHADVPEHARHFNMLAKG